MNKLINLTLFLHLFALLLGCDTRPSPEKLLKQARSKISHSDFISHNSLYLWENVLNEVDTFRYELEFQRHHNEFFHYNYVAKGIKTDIVYINNDFKIVNHSDSTIEVFSHEEQAKSTSSITQTMALAFNPVLLLELEDWEYIKDTTVADKKYFNYFLVKSDTTINGKDIYLEQHLFINEKSGLADFYSSRLYHNGEKAQFIHSYFTDYSFSKDQGDLVYPPPTNYISKTSTDKSEKPVMLKEGVQAPDFELADMNGNHIKLSDLKGQKVFIDFSMINCGWCKVALENFNQPDFEFKDNIQPLYINPVDKKEEIRKYMDLYHIPFPVIAEAKQVGKAYGVSGYPSFFLIDENGTIEKSFMGYDKGIINSLKK